MEGRSKFKELLAAGAPRHPIGRFRPRRPGGSGTFSNFELWAPEVAVLGLLAVLAKNFLGALRAQSEGQGNLSMHPQGDNLYGYGPTTHFLAYFRLVLGATNTPPAPRFRPILGLAAPAAPFGSFGTFRDLGSPEPQNMHVHVLGILADRPPRRPTFRPRVPPWCRARGWRGCAQPQGTRHFLQHRA